MRSSNLRRGGLAPALVWILVSLAVVAVCVVLLQSRSAPSGGRSELVLFCAAGYLKPTQEAAAQYEKEFGGHVRIEADASGTLLSKLRVAGQHADLFLCADAGLLQDARQHGLVAEVLPVARQHLVLAVAAKNPQKIAQLDDLLREGVKVAIPNPESAAAGRAAQRLLTAAGKWEPLQKQLQQFQAKVSHTGTVNEAAQAVKVGTADAALVWDATARQFGLEIVDVPAWASQTPEAAAVAVVAQGRQPTAALHFARYLTAADRGGPIFRQQHFDPPADADAWADQPSLIFMSGAMLKPAIDDLIKKFSDREGVTIKTIYNGCGVHVAQMKAIQKGAAPELQFPDAYFACDVSFMNSVQQWFEAARSISRNDIVLAVAKGNPQHVKSLADLARLELRVGLAHPVNSALGALTDDLLKKLNLHAKIYAEGRRTPIVHTDAGHMLVNQLRTGALDAVVVYRSNVLSAAESEKYLDVVDMNLPEAIAIQPYAVAKNSRHKQLMLRFLEAVLTPTSQATFEKVGFQWVAGKTSP